MVVEMFVEHETVQVDTETSCDDGSASSLDLLQSAFPHNSREELDELLMLYNGDVDSVLEMLSSWQALGCLLFPCQTSMLLYKLYYTL